MTSDANWESDLPKALERARNTQRFVLADFSREH
jgi:hypothetical protein